VLLHDLDSALTGDAFGEDAKEASDEGDEPLTLEQFLFRKATQDSDFERAIQLWLEHRDRWRAGHHPPP
jgi:hypothetical protein